MTGRNKMEQQSVIEDEIRHYMFRVQWSPEDEEYVGTVVEIPGLSWLDDSPEAALAGIQKVTGEAVADMRKEGSKPPQPFADRHYSGRFVVRISPLAHRQLAEEAAEEGVSLNSLAAEKLEKPLERV